MQSPAPETSLKPVRKSQLIWLGLLILAILANLFYLDWRVFFSPEKELPKKEIFVSPPTVAPTLSSTSTPIPPQVFGQQQAVTPTPDNECPAACLAEMAKEIYIPLGSGSTKSRDWVALAGVEAVIDSANFPDVKSMILEASLRIPTANGRVYVKLYDVTAKHDVWFSEVWAEGSTSYRAESAEISLPPGRHLYRLMMKSTMGYEAILDFARIKIILK